MWIQASKAAAAAVIMVAALATLLPRTAQAASGTRSASQALDVTQLVQVALEVNPQVRAARARWEPRPSLRLPAAWQSRRHNHAYRAAGRW